MAETYQIRKVVHNRDLKKFLEVPDAIYKSESHFIKPLHLHTKMMLGPLDEKDKHLFIACWGELPVARLAIKLHPHGPEALLHYGFFECQKGHTEAAKELFAEAHSLYPQLSMMGPYHFRMEDPYVGTMVKGFDEDPYIFMPYNPAYYDEAILGAGLNKAMDLFTYDFDVIRCPDQIHRIAQRASKRGTSVRWLDPKKLRSEVHVVADIFNDALSQNWGFEPITEDQLDEMFMVFKYVIDPRLVCFTVRDGREIGCLILLPNHNPIVKRARGKLSPSFIWNLLTQRKKFDTARGYALGMRQGHQGSGNVCQLIDAMFDRGLEIGLKHVEISWVLENNQPMTEMSKSIGGTHNKTYRVYEKAPLQ